MAPWNTDAYAGGNVLIDSLPTSDRERFVEHLTLRCPETPDVLLEADARIEQLVFPIDALVSLTARLAYGDACEVAMLGRYGVLGAELALGSRAAWRSGLTEIGGTCAYVSAGTFMHFLRETPTLARGVHEFVGWQMFVVQQVHACNLSHGLRQRCACWVLMCRDQLGRDRFELREEFLATMIGVAPADEPLVGATLGDIEGLDYDGDIVTVRSIDGLIEASCECYVEQRRRYPQPSPDGRPL